MPIRPRLTKTKSVQVNDSWESIVVPKNIKFITFKNIGASEILVRINTPPGPGNFITMATGDMYSKIKVNSVSVVSIKCKVGLNSTLDVILEG